MDTRKSIWAVPGTTWMRPAYERPALIPIAHGRDAADVAMSTLWCRSKMVEQSVEVCAHLVIERF